MAVVGLVLFLVGIIFVIVAPINMRKNSRCSAETQGVLSDIHVGRNSRGVTQRTYYYTYSVDSVEYQTKSTIASKQVTDIGDACTLWYNPKKPGAAQPFHYETNKGYIIILIVGIVLIVGGFVLIAAGLANG